MRPKLTTKKVCVECNEPILDLVTNNQSTHPGDCRKAYQDKVDSHVRPAYRRKREWEKTLKVIRSLGIDASFLYLPPPAERTASADSIEMTCTDLDIYPSSQLLALIRTGVRERQRNVRKTAKYESELREKEAKLERDTASMKAMKRDMDLKGSTRQPTPRTITKPNGTTVTTYRHQEPEFDYDTQAEADEHLAWRDGILKDKPNVVFGNHVLDGRRPPRIRYPNKK